MTQNGQVMASECSGKPDTASLCVRVELAAIHAFEFNRLLSNNVQYIQSYSGEPPHIDQLVITGSIEIADGRLKFIAATLVEVLRRLVGRLA